MRIAIDAHGGDKAPAAAVEGTLRAAKELPDAELILVGKPEEVEPMIRAAGKPSNVTLAAAEEVIEADDEPAKAVRRKKQSSMVIAGRMVREGQADALVSAGNTGALMATGLLVVGRIEGIERPALAPILPTMDGVGMLALDLGANMDSTPEHLVQYAIMGSLYRSRVHGMEKPRVGLLNVGTEPMKGNELTKAAFEQLERAPVNFIGNVESRDVLFRNCDVLVCDGFAGNIMLKSMEGTATAVFKALKEQFTSSLWTKLAAAVLAPGIRRFRSKMDYATYGGAPMLGVNGVCVKAHGSSDAQAFANGIKQAYQEVRHQLVQTIASEFSRK
ncbi:phosphate acyltransferase PlsX [Paenibacillus thermoaerophilus]|uniref:Phosphate acyltransferase n=1 Tax=Paenibacillus thermoaerophilus TaxID=1215385 RepID=A0ABW2V0E9_9BACL|nr:phosphate acyltransferase PlsX [Paenibacillus thermoaerophilus]TMV19177.1 phosphate acyltransferase PlsX [Paenibacillus thermoaerophilus]